MAATPTCETSCRNPAPFLKWAGGKRAVLPHLRAGLPARFGCYHEPFVGGGALFFGLAGEHPRPMRRAVVSDLNLRLVRTWRAVRDEPGRLLDLLGDHEERYLRAREEYFYEVRAMDLDEQGDDVKLGAWLVFLNRTAFNGLYRVNRKNRFNVPHGRYEAPTIRNDRVIHAASRALQGVEVLHESFDKVMDRAAPGDVVYFDPPYVPLTLTSSFTAYTGQGFDMDDQVRLRDVALTLKGRGVIVMLSNHDTPEVRELYRRGFTLQAVGVRRAINSKGASRGKVGELVIR